MGRKQGLKQVRVDECGMMEKEVGVAKRARGLWALGAFGYCREE